MASRIYDILSEKSSRGMGGAKMIGPHKQNKWVSFIKAFSKQTGMSYTQALQSAQAHKAYCKKYGLPASNRICKYKSKLRAKPKSKAAKKKCTKNQILKMIQYTRKSGKKVGPFEKCVKKRKGGDYFFDDEDELEYY